MSSPVVLVFDSGLGGLSVYRELVRARPDARFVYAADDALFPYGTVPEERLIRSIVAQMDELIARHSPDVVVIACNTASVQVLPALRERFKVPFVGTVPAIKPACAASATKLVSVLGTKATVAREYTHALVQDFAQGCEVTLVGSARLAPIAEAALRGELVEDAVIAAEIGPCFVEQDERRTDIVVLACTHYPLLVDRLEHVAPWRVTWIDPAPAIARRMVDLIGPPTGEARTAPARALFTSGRPPGAPLAAALARFGLEALQDMPA